jgi:drug/metabolite transporter (DMT)-like permease
VAGSLTGALQQALAVVFALAGAACYAVASVVQQRSAAQLSSAKAFDPAVLLRLARARRWLLSLIAVAGGFGCQATALDLGRLVVVEPVFPAGLLFALLLAARVEGRRLRHSEWTAAVATVAGLAAFLVAAEPSGGNRTAGAGVLSLAAVGAACVAGLSCLVALRVSAHHRALALSVGGGVGAGVTDALTKTATTLAGLQRLAIFADIRLYLLAGVGLLTFTMQQNGFRAAGLSASLPAFAVLEPLVGSLLGLTIYHEHVGGGAGRVIVEVMAVLAAAWGIARLAKSVIEVSARLAAAALPAVPADPAA